MGYAGYRAFSGSPSGRYLYFMSLCAESLYKINFFLLFHYVFFSFLFRLCPFLKSRSFVLGLSFDFFVFYSGLIKLESGFQKNNLSGFNRVWVRWFFFISHAISLWYCDVCGFVTLVSCVGDYINPSNRNKKKFEMGENWLDLLSV